MVYLGQTIRIKCKFYDFNDNVITENLTHSIVLKDPNGTQKFSSTSPSLDAADNSFYVDVTIDSNWPAGNYTVVWTATQGSNSWVTKTTFNVESV
jgi:methionine-rich copper-binding protein CopC